MTYRSKIRIPEVTLESAEPEIISVAPPPAMTEILPPEAMREMPREAMTEMSAQATPATILEEVVIQEAPPPFYVYARKVYASFRQTPFHEAYYRILEKFARREIRRLIVSVPPQHGKSLGASVLLPSYLLGLDPELKVAIASYSSSLASRFNRRVQRLIDSDKYAAFFPGTKVKPLSGRSEYARTATQTDIVGCGGELFSVGREGPLTGNEVDVFILDDLYKDALEANSPVIRENCWEWYTSVVKTRLHNDSSELIVFTRWHEEDLIGTILSLEEHIVLQEWEQLEGLDPSVWVVVNFEALKESPPTGIDPRTPGEPLWPAKHSVEHLESRRALDPFRFACMYQGRPSPRDGFLYGDKFRTYERLPEDTVRKGNYTDTADLGDDYLCSVCYEVGRDGMVYVTDAVYSRAGMEVTEQLVADMLRENQTRYALVESNNGGRGFARAVGKLVPHLRVEWFHQGGNKESRVLSNSATVLHNVLMPADWHRRWPELRSHLVTYRRLFRANRWHDAPDVLTGIVEKEVMDPAGKRIRKCL